MTNEANFNFQLSLSQLVVVTVTSTVASQSLHQGREGVTSKMLGSFCGAFAIWCSAGGSTGSGGAAAASMQRRFGRIMQKYTTSQAMIPITTRMPTTMTRTAHHLRQISVQVVLPLYSEHCCVHPAEAMGERRSTTADTKNNELKLATMAIQISWLQLSLSKIVRHLWRNCAPENTHRRHRY